MTEFAFDEVIDAFRLMASGRHIGKILVSMPGDGRIRGVAPPPPQPLVGGMGDTSSLAVWAGSASSWLGGWRSKAPASLS